MNLTKRVNIEPAALDVVRQMDWQRTTHGQFVGKLPPVQLDRKLYDAVNKGLEALGGKWNKSLKAHLFVEDPRPGILAMLDLGHVEVEKDGYFPTPDAVIEKMVFLYRQEFARSYFHRSDDEPVEIIAPILEPSAGEGAICDYLMRNALNDPSDIVVVEKNERRAAILAGKGYTVSPKRDFLQFKGEYPTIFMNPPFERMQDVHHILHAFEDCLSIHGTMISVCSEGPFFREGERALHFRNTIYKYGKSWKLAPGSFKESGTGINARLVYLEKRER